MTARKANIEVLIQTLNEELNLPHSLESVSGWVDRVHVVDSESTDRTREIAESFGANFVTRPWLGFARQKNWSLSNLPWEADWIFILDADESITPELRDELLAISQRPVEEIPEAGFYINRLTYFMHRPIRRCGYFPSWNLRFFRTGSAHYEERDVHEHMHIEGSTRHLQHLMLHNDRRGVEIYIRKHVQYAMLEAGEMHRAMKGQADTPTAELSAALRFRRWVKHNVIPHLPAPWLFRFFYMYIFKLGILDGMTGFRFCLMISAYELFISLRLIELRREDREPAVELPTRGEASA